MLMALHRMGRSDLTVHGFRATFSSWVAAKTGFSFEVREAALAHQVSEAVVRAYQRDDFLQKRRELMRVWAAYCTGPAPAGEVVSFSDARNSA
jgi:integrase